VASCKSLIWICILIESTHENRNGDEDELGVFVGFVQQLSLEFQRPSVKGSKANVCVELSNAIQRGE